jgi:hypothetical protein
VNTLLERVSKMQWSLYQLFVFCFPLLLSFVIDFFNTMKGVQNGDNSFYMIWLQIFRF